MVVVAVLLFHAFQRQLTGAFFAFALHPEAMALLEQSREDQRLLATLDPESRDAYRQRFDEVQRLVQRMKILEHNREELARRYEQVLLALFLGTIALATGSVLWQRRRDEDRLERLRLALADLAAGRTDLHLGKLGGGTLGRIAGMVEETSRRMARDRRRLRSLENLSAWQEAARRHAHEMKTPLTGARLELERLDGMVGTPDQRDEARDAVRSVRQELERLGRFTREFTSFARLPRPSLGQVDLAELVSAFVDAFAGAWDNLRLELPASDGDGAIEPGPRVLADRDMLRQVLVNLCDNSSLALASREPASDGAEPGRIAFSWGVDGDQAWLEVADDGPGVDPSLAERIFEPYVTTRTIGEGMGLGLAICRKILLDHGGDLELVRDGRPGAVFRLGLPTAEAALAESGSQARL